MSSGSAASVVNTQREGVGFLLQSVYWPELADKDGNLVNWAGDVYAYWLDDEGGLFLDDGSKPGYLDSTDSKVNVWYDTNAAPNRARACVNGTIVDGACVDGVVKEIDAVKHLWSVSSWLNKKELQTSAQREYDKNTNGRYIMTWSDDGDGAVQSGEYVSFTSENFTSDLLDSAVVEWLRGADGELRSRKILSNIDTDEEVVWRLGDVINSSPTVVGRPSENFDLIWEDDTYTKFYTKYYNRRTMVYFGGNDGMLHAINAGFYSETDKAFCRSISTNGSCMADDGFELGAEMWAYVPYNLHPHLSCLANKQYQHQYYVDLKPRVFEVQIWKEENDPDHPYGWGTILVTGFNFGGDGKQSLEFDSQYFGSSFSVFDITNPEKAPVFLGEFTYDDYTFGYALNQPTVVAVKDSADNKHWYMLMGTGPQDPSGASTQKAGVVVVPLAKLVDQDTNQANTSFPLRLDKNTFKPGMDKIGVITLSDSNSAMGTGFSAVDYDFDFFVDMMYYGTVVTPNKGGMTGGVHRLKIEAEPDPSKWERKEMTDTGGPMTGGINVGFKDKNVWVYFGTGKFWDVSDKTDVRTQWMYGIMEPKRTDSDAYNFSTIPVGNLLDVTDFYVRPNNGLGELFCKSTNGTECLPSGVVTVDDLEVYIRDTQKYDGWKRELEAEGERVIVEPSLFGGIANFVASVPSNDYCVSGGSSKLYALYYLTGTAWKENVFGGESGDYVPFTADLGQGIASRPSLHIGKEEGVMLYFQNNNGEIISLAQPVLPTSLIKSGKGGWHTQDVD